MALRKKANIPASVTEPALVAEYIVQELGWDTLEDRILTAITGAKGVPSSAHALISTLPLRILWTTNYDDLLERSYAVDKRYVIVSDSDYRGLRLAQRAVRIMKMHGSAGIDRNGLPHWEAPPTITRADYERGMRRTIRLSGRICKRIT